MKTVLITLAFIAASLSLISAATPARALPTPAAPLPSELEHLRAALGSNREELQWVQELLQQAGEQKAVKASLSANNWQDCDTQARIQALENEREQLRQALANRDQHLGRPGQQPTCRVARDTLIRLQKRPPR